MLAPFEVTQIQSPHFSTDWSSFIYKQQLMMDIRIPFNYSRLWSVPMPDYTVISLQTEKSKNKTSEVGRRIYILDAWDHCNTHPNPSLTFVFSWLHRMWLQLIHQPCNKYVSSDTGCRTQTLIRDREVHTANEEWPEGSENGCVIVAQSHQFLWKPCVRGTIVIDVPRG